MDLVLTLKVVVIGLVTIGAYLAVRYARSRWEVTWWR